MLGAQYSLPFTTAVALARDIFYPVAFDEDALHDPAIRALATRIEVAENAAFAGLDSEVTLEIEGESYKISARGFPGSLEAPLDFAGISKKFRRYVGPLLGESRVDSILGLVRDLDVMEDVSELARSISSPQL